jgi:FKBP-type peptidyl-prolyl cis-trans isomerase 2
MNKLRSKWLYRGVLMAVLLFWIVAAVTAKAAENTEQQKAMETLQKAMEQSKQSGKPVVIDLGPEDPVTVQAGDLVVVNYTVSLEDGRLIATTSSKVAGDPKRKKSESFRNQDLFAAEEILAGGAGPVPGIGEMVVGLKKGGKKTVTLPPDKAFGPRDPKKTAQLPCERRMPKNPALDPRSYVGQFGTFPIVGKEIHLTPYFKSRIVEVAENFVRLESLAKGGEKGQEPFGTTEVQIEGEEIVIRLNPKLGADFEINNQKGKIVSTDGSTFTVDFNPPLAGKPVVLDLEVVSLTQASAFKGMEIAWMEDHDKALDKAKKEKKPVVLMLYAPWCSWSKKLMNEAMEDPRIKVMKDKFVWAKVNSETQKDLYQFYEQKGFPLTVILSPDGEIIGKIDGYREAGALKKDLEGALGTKVAKTAK